MRPSFYLAGCLLAACASAEKDPVIDGHQDAGGGPAEPLGPLPARSFCGRSDVALDLVSGSADALGKTTMPSMLPELTTHSGQCTLAFGPYRMTVDGDQGARITELSYDGHNVLSGPEINVQNFGSTFWPSPQSLWGWPPVAALDSEGYRGGVAGTELTLQSQPGKLGEGENPPQFQVKKHFVPNPTRQSFDVTYRLAYVAPESGPAVEVAPWQITRVRGTGSLTFFALGSGPLKAAPELPIQSMEGVGWYAFSPASQDSKTFADGQGWIAHVTRDRLLLVLEFEDITPSDSPDGEAEIELYTGSPAVAGDYVELEPQGKKQRLLPGQSLDFTVRFYVRPLPSGMEAQVGNSSLVQFVRSLLRS